MRRSTSAARHDVGAQGAPTLVATEPSLTALALVLDRVVDAAPCWAINSLPASIAGSFRGAAQAGIGGRAGSQRARHDTPPNRVFHPASRRRSYFRFRDHGLVPVRTFTVLIRRHAGRTERGFSATKPPAGGRSRSGSSIEVSLLRAAATRYADCQTTGRGLVGSWVSRVEGLA